MLLLSNTPKGCSEIRTGDPIWNLREHLYLQRSWTKTSQPQEFLKPWKS